MEEERKEPTWFPNAKVYHNGSHYIAIPHTENKSKKRPRPKEPVYVVAEEMDEGKQERAVKTARILPTLEIMDDDEDFDCPFEEADTVEDKPPNKDKKEHNTKTKLYTYPLTFYPRNIPSLSSF